MAITEQGIVLYNAVEENKVGALLFRVAMEARDKARHDANVPWEQIATLIQETSARVAALSGETGNVLKFTGR